MEKPSRGQEPEIRVAVGADEQEERRRSHSDLGDRVTGVLEAAEEVAEQIRADARGDAAGIRREAEEAGAAHLREVSGQLDRLRNEAQQYAEDVKQTGESYATQQRREAEAEAARLLSQAEAEARAVRETAEEMAKRIEHAAHERRERIDNETRGVEARLQRTVAGMRDVTRQLEDLLGQWAEPRDEESLVEALRVEGRSEAPH
jgi:F0F1-type ATP synthase membrane subunit b/b'